MVCLSLFFLFRTEMFRPETPLGANYIIRGRPYFLPTDMSTCLIHAPWQCWWLGYMYNIKNKAVRLKICVIDMSMWYVFISCANRRQDDVDVTIDAGTCFADCLSNREDIRLDMKKRSFRVTVVSKQLSEKNVRNGGSDIYMFHTSILDASAIHIRGSAWFFIGARENLSSFLFAVAPYMIKGYLQIWINCIQYENILSDTDVRLHMPVYKDAAILVDSRT
jgi:hypothetical protein